MKIRLSLFEIFLAQTALWLGIWLFSDYIAALLTLIIGAIVSAVLAIAVIAEAIERSNVPKTYFKLMGLALLSMAVAAGLYILLLGGRMDFLQIR